MRIRSPFLVQAAGLLTCATLWTLFRTLRFQMHTASIDPYGHNTEHYLFAVWHDSAVMATFGGKHHRTVALTSRHRDGTFVASILQRVNIQAVRGSSSEGGQRAALELLKLAEANDVVITPDGPRGPRRTISRGIVYLASRTGNAIIPTGFACSNAWELSGSWTSLTVPKPFSRVALVVGSPIAVPRCLTDGDMLGYVKRVQAAMEEVQGSALKCVTGKTTTPSRLAANSSGHKAA